MANESPEKEFSRYSKKLFKDESHASKETQSSGSKTFKWVTAIILFLFTLALGIIVGITITPKSTIYSPRNKILSKYCQIFHW
ncbi:hypothetical protein AM10699_67970 (plasmid) [Acaryochloris marina MBIC10699]|nr:hypothetical protein AM10699_67970 [Acaryochloris marina MBIC10699]